MRAIISNPTAEFEANVAAFTRLIGDSSIAAKFRRNAGKLLEQADDKLAQIEQANEFMALSLSLVRKTTINFAMEALKGGHVVIYADALDRRAQKQLASFYKSGQQCSSSLYLDCTEKKADRKVKASYLFDDIILGKNKDAKGRTRIWFQLASNQANEKHLIADFLRFIDSALGLVTLRPIAFLTNSQMLRKASENGLFHTIHSQITGKNIGPYGSSRYTEKRKPVIVLDRKLINRRHAVADARQSRDMS